jgi:seryl-tRNA synthetase
MTGAVAGTGLTMELVDYIPCYRSEAGTGTAQGFAYWD